MKAPKWTDSYDYKVIIGELTLSPHDNRPIPEDYGVTYHIIYEYLKKKNDIEYKYSFDGVPVFWALVAVVSLFSIIGSLWLFIVGVGIIVLYLLARLFCYLKIKTALSSMNSPLIERYLRAFTEWQYKEQRRIVDKYNIQEKTSSENE